MTDKEKRDMHVRVDRAIWLQARKGVNFPKVSDRELSKLLFNTSIIRYKDDIGRFIYGKNNWEKAFYDKNKRK